MNITSILRLTAAFVALSISVQAAEVFSVVTSGSTFPTTTAANFAGGDFDIYGTTDAGNGSAWGGGVGNNFDGVTAITPGDQNSVTNGQGVTTSTTYFGPKVYAGLNRDAYQIQAGVHNSNGNGYRIRVNNVSAVLIGTAQVGTAQVGTAQVGTAQVGEVGDEDYAPASADYAPASADYAPASADYAEATGLGGVSPTARAVFMFDADTSTLSGEGDNLIFGDSDTLTAKLAVANNMGPGTGTGVVNRASLATYRPMVKAGGEYYAGPLYTVDLTTLSGGNSTNFDITNTGASSSWTLVPNMESSNNSVVGANNHPENLTVDISAATVPGYTLTNITQVGFLLVATSEIQNGGFNYGVREFAVQATPANAPDPIEYSQDFTTTVSIADGFGSSTGDPYSWVKRGDGLTATTPTTVSQDETNDNVVISITENGNAGQAFLSMVGPGTTNARRVKPASHEITWEIDLLAYKQGDADINLQTRGHDGYVKSTIAPSGQIKFMTWMADYNHKNFDDFSGPSRLRVNTNNQSNNGVSIETGGTFDPLSADPVTITISGNAVGTVNMNTAGDAVESVTIVDQGSGYIADPTVTFAGGGMTVAPTVSFNYSTGNLYGATNPNNGQNTHVLDVDLGLILPMPSGNKNWNVLADGQIFTYIQSYDSSDESISYYFSLTDKSTGEVTGPLFITTLTAADHSAGGHGFYDVVTGNKYTTPSNRDAVEIHYKRYDNADAVVSTIAINSVTLATSDDDRDGVINRKDALPNDPFESVDTDSDGVGDNADQYPNLNDSVINAGITQEVWDASQTALTTAQTAQATAETALITAQSDLTTAQADLTTAQDALANSLSLSDIQDLRAGSTMIAVSDGSATVSLQMEESQDLSSWSDLGAAVPFTVTLDPSDDTQFFRVKLAD